MTEPKLTRRSVLAKSAQLTASLALGTARASVPKYPRDLTKEEFERWLTELSNWGKWGKDDQAGTVNLITPAKRKAAARMVRDGVSISLALDADLPKPGTSSGAPATWKLTPEPLDPKVGPAAASARDAISVFYHGYDTTHLDVPSHRYYKGQVYNGYPQAIYTDSGAGKDDVMAFKDGILTRGVLFDIPRLKDVPYLRDDEPIYAEDLEAWEKKAGFRLESGDAMLVRTGRWARVEEKGPLDLSRQSPGLYVSCVKWMRERGAAILGSDVTQDVRPTPLEREGVRQPVHLLALFALGMPLIDDCELEALSRAAMERRRWTFLLTIDPLRVPGATGGPINPIATF